VSGLTDAAKLLRAGVLEGTSIVCAGEHGPIGEEIERACAELGAHVTRWEPGEQVSAHVLCYDGAATFAARSGEREALDACLELAWEATRELVAARLLERHGESATAAPARARDEQASAERRERDGYPSRIVYIAPRAGSGTFADAASSGLENLARTLSIEWARYGVRTVAIAPGADVAAPELAALAAYLSSPAGGYFSGCLLDLRGPSASSPP
jgi:hypothetical protein